ncbi:MAG: hypothetical protein MR390_01275 [Oscillospiraceae bacterium]|nr:hypothetical protein [Oscillospiraceae bacterium]MDY3938522.1 hypothetical protein [Oscillospiraceae bacterium]
MENLIGGILSVCVFSVIGSVALWLNGSDKMKKTLKLCLSVLTLSLIFSFLGNFELNGDLKINGNSCFTVSDDEIIQSAGNAVISICKNVLHGFCDDEPDIYYDSDVLVVKVSDRDINKAKQIEQVLGNIVLSQVRIITE